MFFSLLGLCIILKQLILDSKKFSEYRPNTFSNWSKSFPTLKPVIPISGITGGSITAKACLTDSLPDSDTIEQKVDFLLQRIHEVQTAIHGLDDRIDGVAASITKETDNLKTQLDTVHKSLTEIIAGHIVGSYDITLFGIIITICGILIQFFCSNAS